MMIFQIKYRELLAKELHDSVFYGYVANHIQISTYREVREAIRRIVIEHRLSSQRLQVTVGEPLYWEEETNNRTMVDLLAILKYLIVYVAGMLGVCWAIAAIF